MTVVLRPTQAYEQRDQLVTLQWSGLWDVISLQTLCWEIGDTSRTRNKDKMRCSVVFGVTLRLLVISSSSPATNSATYYQRHVSQLAGRWPWSGGVVLTTPGQSMHALKLRIAISACLPHLHSTPPLAEFPSGYCNAVWYRKTTMAWLADDEKHIADIFIHFDRCTNVTDTQTDKRTDRHRMTT